jgi:choline dehydrogenase
MDLSRPASRGRVRLRSPDSGVAPSIVFNHLAEKSDLEDLIDGILLGRQIVRQSALSSLSTGELLPGAHIQSRADLRLWVQANLGTSYHPSGTCRMGRGPGSVVDAQGLVHGTSALRVVDGSIMPRTVTANISAAIYMLAEKIADAIRGRPALSAKLLTPNATELSTAGQSLGR